MRFCLAAVLSLSLFAPAAGAMPVAAPFAPIAYTPVAKKQAARAKAPKARGKQARRGKSDLGGIHPLVGSGDY